MRSLFRIILLIGFEVAWFLLGCIVGIVLAFRSLGNSIKRWLEEEKNNKWL